MGDNERDTHFAGFARLLRQDIFAKLNFLDFGFSDQQQATIDRGVDKMIAQRVYDLVMHTLLHVEHIDLDRLTDEEHAKKIPDLTEWPQPTQSGLSRLVSEARREIAAGETEEGGFDDL
jgi:hypothetical protein